MHVEAARQFMNQAFTSEYLPFVFHTAAAILLHRFYPISQPVARYEDPLAKQGDALRMRDNPNRYGPLRFPVPFTLLPSFSSYLTWNPPLSLHGPWTGTNWAFQPHPYYLFHNHSPSGSCLALAQGGLTGTIRSSQGACPLRRRNNRFTGNFCPSRQIWNFRIFIN